MKRSQSQKIIHSIILFLTISSLFYGSTSIYLLEQNFYNNYYQTNLNNWSLYLNDSFITINYDVLTQTEKIGDNYNILLAHSFENVVSPYLGSTSTQQDLQTSYPFPPDNRTQISDTSIYPWSTICKLFITSADNNQFIGSGAILDEYHVLTCGHCVYLHDYGGWASEVKVVPGMAGTYEPFGHAIATNYRTYDAWVQGEMYQHDWAVITLDRTIGNLTGWMGRKTADPSSSIYTGVLHTAGYPGDLDFGNYMYYDSDLGETADDYNHWFWMDTAGGQSGSPVWQNDSGDLYILTINAYEYEGGTYANFGTRLNNDKLARISEWIAEDTPPNGNNGGYTPDLSFLIPVFIIIGVIVVVIAIVIVIVRRSKPKPRVVEPSEVVTNYYSYQPEPSSNNDFFNFCPNCGRGILRDTQKFCTSCGYRLHDLMDT
ncbi:MAG: trypsin-like peptidase domain-containing protein [Promethearchaeota archaeon]